MPQNKIAQLNDRSNSRSPPEASTSQQDADLKQRPFGRYTLYPKISSSEATPSSDQSSVYDASVCRSVDEDDKRAIVGENEAGRRQGRGWGRKRKRAVPPVDPPPGRPRAPNNVALVEVRFNNRPDGTPLTTIIEQRSSLSLRRQISDISAKRRFTPVHVDASSNYVHTTKPPVDAGRHRISLSLDEAAIREFRKIFQDGSEANGSESTIYSDFNKGKAYGQPLKPSYPPYERLKTPPGKPRWPGDLTPAEVQQQASPRRFSLTNLRSAGSHRYSSRRASAGDLHIVFEDESSARRLGRAVRGFFYDPNDGPFLPALANQPRRTATVPPRVGRAYWQPPRSGQGTFSFEGSNHPLYNAPVARPATQNDTYPIPRGSLSVTEGEEFTADTAIAESLGNVSNETSPIEANTEASRMVFRTAEYNDTRPQGRHVHWEAGEEQPGMQVTRITSAALPILLPLAERAGIVQPIQLQPQNASEHPGSFRRHRSSYHTEQHSLDGAPEHGQAHREQNLFEHSHRHRCPHVLPEARASPGREVTIGRISVSVKQGDRCWQCKVERAMKWVAQSCFCQVDDCRSDSGNDNDQVRVIRQGG
ncbi:hypothetical protein NA57DRAFT_50553 [Rhizodiscina lignyota]|uniref:Uncharacterized protein n=1 Tax=Rhizodiscina lignyota TaxID=1504668 RepID=A0A9P4ISY1_9PEZI|nr:hypothetical protein NA57DRAFT_50553 [Rhizodiscina lignyota]